MRCPVCVRYNCTCSDEHWHREVRKSFDAPAKWARIEQEEQQAKVASEPKAKSGRRDRSNGQVPGTQNPSPPGDPQ